MIKITEKEFRQLAAYIKDNYGIHLKDEKQFLVSGRLQNVVSGMGFSSFGEYYDFVINGGGDAVTTLIDRITTNHTYFMREAEHFDFFKKETLPYIYENSREKDLRVWCAACSSGEEAYTLAMIIDEFFEGKKQGWDTKILATDISSKVLEQARAGIYDSERVKPLPVFWKQKYFSELNSKQAVVGNGMKNQVIYKKFNLMDHPFPFRKKFHAIFCRNVMIYFDLQTKKELVSRLYEALEQGGYLFIGLSESLNRDITEFRYIRPSVYRKMRF